MLQAMKNLVNKL